MSGLGCSKPLSRAALKHRLLETTAQSNSAFTMMAFLNNNSLQRTDRALKRMKPILEIHQAHAKQIQKLTTPDISLIYLSTISALEVVPHTLETAVSYPSIWPEVLLQVMEVELDCHTEQRAFELANDSPFQTHPDLEHVCTIWAGLEATERKIRNHALQAALEQGMS